MARFNVHRADYTYAPDRPDGYRCGTQRFTPLIGGAAITGTVYEVPAGESTIPYHYEYGAEEWLLVLDGRPTLRHPDGEDELEPGDLVCFPEGPAGAHKVTNHGDEPARVMIISTYSRPAVAVFPDSDKVGVWTNEEEGGPVIVERSSGVGYWHGEG
jgi:uncharacterized cupin superfamily protein